MTNTLDRQEKKENRKTIGIVPRLFLVLRVVFFYFNHNVKQFCNVVIIIAIKYVK